MSDISGLEMQMHLQMQLKTIAQRIIEAARLAASAHLYQSELDSPESDSGERYGRRVGIGGADPVTPGGAEASRLPHRGARVERVTDDELPAPPPSARRPWHHPAD